MAINQTYSAKATNLHYMTSLSSFIYAFSGRLWFCGVQYELIHAIHCLTAYVVLCKLWPRLMHAHPPSVRHRSLV